MQDSFYITEESYYAPLRPVQARFLEAAKGQGQSKFSTLVKYIVVTMMMRLTHINLLKLKD